MKTFIKNCILFFVIIVSIVIFGLVLPNNSKPRSIDYSLIAKHERLAEIKEPKIILTGGSNVLFGFNSKMISDSLNKPVVNHAIHAGYGLKYILDDVLPFINKGDTLIVAPEYSHFLGNSYLGKEPLLFSLTAVPKNLKLLGMSQIINISSFIPKFAFDRMKSFIYGILIKPKDRHKPNVYGEYAINEFGDNYTHWGLEQLKFESYAFEGNINAQAFDYLKKVNKAIEKRNAKLIISFPSLCESTYKLNKNIIDTLEVEFRKFGLTILGQPTDFVYPDSYFFDTVYHLNEQGVALRSKGLISELSKK